MATLKFSTDVVRHIVCQTLKPFCCEINSFQVIEMEAKRNVVIALHLEGKTNIQIRRAMPEMQLNKLFVSRTIKRFVETGSIKKRYGGGRKCTATSHTNIEKIRQRMNRKSARSAIKMAQDLNVSEKSVRRVLKITLKLKPLKKNTCQELNHAQKKMRLKRSKALIRMYDCGQLPNLVFSDEKTFCVEQFVNKQIDRVWLKGRSSDHSDELRVTRPQGAAQVMVWSAVTEIGRSLLFLKSQPAVISKPNIWQY